MNTGEGEVEAAIEDKGAGSFLKRLGDASRTELLACRQEVQNGDKDVSRCTGDRSQLGSLLAVFQARALFLRAHFPPKPERSKRIQLK